MAPPTLLSGLYDLEPVMLSHVNEWPHLGRESTHRNSPIHRLAAGPVPLTFSFGPGETAEFKRQTETYLAACHAVGCDCGFAAVPGANHFDIVLSPGDSDSPLTKAVGRTMGVGDHVGKTKA